MGYKKAGCSLIGLGSRWKSILPTGAPDASGPVAPLRIVRRWVPFHALGWAALPCGLAGVGRGLSTAWPGIFSSPGKQKRRLVA